MLRHFSPPRNRHRMIVFYAVLPFAIMLGLLVASFPLAPARADTTATIVNFDAAGNQVTRYDGNDNAVDAHDGGIMRFGATYYLYGTSYDCGFRWQTSGAAFCGFKSYSSTDLVHWTDQGTLFDATTSTWQSRCGGVSNGCFRPHVIYNSSTGNYVLWINDYSTGQNYRVFEATQPIGPFTEVATPTLALNRAGGAGTISNGDENLFVDDNGTAYITYTNRASPNEIVVEQLTANYESGTGSYAVVATGGYEAPAMFKRNGSYYVTYGPLCAYCGGTGTQYKMATSPLGAYSGGSTFVANSCGGQNTHVAVIPTSGGTTYLYQSDLWNNGARNEALANYFWAPLGFNSDGSIQSLTCTASLALTLTGGVAGSQNIPANRDQWDGVASFRTWCDIGGNGLRLQTFTPAQSGMLADVALTSFQSGTPNAALNIDIVSVNGSGTPTGTLSSTAIPVSAVGWSARNVTVKPNIAVTAGTTYGILAHSATSSGCYGWTFNDSNVYPRGQEFYTFNGGSSYTLESNRALKFETTIGSLGDVALGATPAASSSFEACCGWGLAKVNDGQSTSSSTSMGWSSANTLQSNHTEWVQVNLGSAKLVSEVDLAPRSDAGNVGYGFPVDFTIQLSPNGVNWTTVVTQTGDAIPTSGNVKTFTFTPQDAQYIRVQGTNLSNANPNDPTYRMQLAEVVVS